MFGIPEILFRAILFSSQLDIHPKLRVKIGFLRMRFIAFSASESFVFRSYVWFTKKVTFPKVSISFVHTHLPFTINV